MLADWRRLQQDIWVAEEDARQLSAACDAELKGLSRQRRYHALLRASLRNLHGGRLPGAAAPGAAPAATPCAEARDAEPPDLAAVVGPGAASASAALLRGLAARPRAVALLAAAAGPAAHEAFAHVAAAALEDPLLAAGCHSGGRASDLVRALDDLLGPGIAASVGPRLGDRALRTRAAVAFEAAAVLEDGSFVAALLQRLTERSLEGASWQRSVLTVDLHEAISRLAQAERSRNRQAAACAKSASERSAQVHSVTSRGAPLRRLESFLGEDPGGGSVCRLESAVEHEGEVARELCGAAAAFVSSLCARAPAAPPALCRIAAVVCRQLTACVDGEDLARGEDGGAASSADAAGRRERTLSPLRLASRAAAAAVYALLGGLLLKRWLVPALLSRGAGVGHAPNGALTDLTQLLAAIASPGPEPEPPGVAQRFVQEQRQRLQAGLFDVLIERGSVPGAEAMDVAACAWPSCLVCTGADLRALHGAVASEAAAAVAASVARVPIQQLEALSSHKWHAHPDDAEFVCWLQRGCIYGLGEGATGESSPGPGSSFISVRTSIVSQLKPPAWQAESAGAACATMHAAPPSYFLDTADSDGSSLAGDEVDAMPVEGLRACQAEAQGALATAPSPAAPDVDLGAPDVDLGAGDALQLRPCVELLWDVLADARPLDGDAGASLAEALLARSGAEAKSGSVPQQVCEELLLELLRSRGGADPEALLRGARGLFEAELVAWAPARRALNRARAAGRVLRRSCQELAAEVRMEARLSVEARCLACLRALWSSTQPLTGGEPFDGFSLCIVGPSIEMFEAQAAPCQACPRPPKRSWLANIFGQPSPEELIGGSAPNVLTARQSWSGTLYWSGDASVLKCQVFYKACCPYHRGSLAGDASSPFPSPYPPLDLGLRHFTVRSLRQAIAALRHLPLRTAVRADDPCSIAGAVQQLVQAIAAHVVRRGALRASLGPRGWPASCMGRPEAGEDPDAPRPAELLVVEERCVTDCVSRFVLGHLHSRLFPIAPTEGDTRLSGLMARLAWLRPRHLDVADELAETPQVELATSLLRHLHLQRSPLAMVELLARSFSAVMGAACFRKQWLVAARRSQEAPSDAASVSKGLPSCAPGLRRAAGGPENAFGADDSLPLFILVVIAANPPMLHSVLAYAECFISREQMLTEQGYALTQARAASSFVECIRGEDLAGLEAGEWDRRMGGSPHRGDGGSPASCAAAS